MKHLLPFFGGFVTFLIVSSVFYMGVMSYPTSSCVVPEDQMNIAAMMLGNGLMVGLAAYMISLIGNFSAASGAKHGAVAGLTANGMLSVFTYAFYTCEGAHIFEMNEVLMDIVANMVFMGIAGAVMGILYQRNAAKS